METVEKSWIPVFERLRDDREKILVQKVHIKGEAKIFKKEESIFFLGELRIIINEKGIHFELPNYDHIKKVQRNQPDSQGDSDS